MKLSTHAQEHLLKLHQSEPEFVQDALSSIAQGGAGAEASLAKLEQKSGLSPSELRDAARLAAEQRLFDTQNRHTKETVGSDQEAAFALADGGRSLEGRWELKFGQKVDKLSGEQLEQLSDQSQQASKVDLRTTAQQLSRVPGIKELEGLKSGDVKGRQVGQALKTALLSDNLKVRKKACQTLQIAESYARKAEQDQENYQGTRFVALPFDKPVISLTAKEKFSLIDKLAKSGDSSAVDILLMAESVGMIQSKGNKFSQNERIQRLATGTIPLLKGSDGRESPRGADSFHKEWVEAVEPGIRNIRSAIIETARARGGGCPFAHGNHAKGVSFGGVEMKVNDSAPDWSKELFGDSLQGGMIRVSGSQTDPDQPDTEAHMPGIRLALPLNGALDGSASQLVDITANTGDVTHAQTAAEHTQFTRNISVPKGPLTGLSPVRAARHALGGALDGKLFERIGQMKNAVEVTGMANDQRFDEHVFFARHAFFVGGRYVQLRFEVLEPKPFEDARDSKAPNGRLDAVSNTIAEKGMKLAMYITEIPEGRPELVEQEGWKNLPETRLATIKVPTQQASKESEAEQWFQDVPHVPGGADKVFHAVGLGRHRVPIYQASGKLRQQNRGSL